MKAILQVNMIKLQTTLSKPSISIIYLTYDDI